MRRYIGYNSLETPKFQSRDHGKRSAMSAHLNREGHYADSSANTFFRQGATDKDLSRNTYEKTQLDRYANDVSFYSDEYDSLLSQMIPEMSDYRPEDALVKLLNFSKLADEALYAQDYDNDILLRGPSSKVLDTLNIGDIWR